VNLEKELLKKQSQTQCNRITNYIGNDAVRFGELVRLFFKGEYRLTQHAAWPMSYCIQNYPQLARPYLKRFVDQLSDQHAHPAAKRNIVRLFQFIEIPKRLHGRLMDICFQFINKPEEPIAVKAFSLHILENLSAIYPEILTELKNIIDARWAFESAAFRSRARKILKKFKNQMPPKAGEMNTQ
jgi:hypothetical protein